MILTPKKLKKMVELAASRPGHGKHRLYAEIWRDGERLSFGWNNGKQCDLLTRFKEGNPLKTGTCAEAEAIVQALGKHKTVRGATVVVVRAKKKRRGGEWVPGYSRPCMACRWLMRDFSLAEFVYVAESEDGFAREEA